MATDEDEALERELAELEREDEHEFYTLLNVDLRATQEEIRSAYRRLCRVYHPDRYSVFNIKEIAATSTRVCFLPCRHQDPKKQQSASVFFQRIQEAYRVLSDPRKRAIYDRSGRKGVEGDMALIERTTLPAELLEEYEKLRKLWEERTYVQEANPQASFQMKVDVSPLIDGVSSSGQSAVSLGKVTATQSVDAPITRSACSTVGATVVGTPQFLMGGIQLALRYILSSRNWVKVSTLIGSLPSVGLETYHNVSDAMYITTNSHCTWTPLGPMLNVNGTATRRLTDSTSASLSVRETGNAVSAQVIHRLSTAVNVVTETRVGFDESLIEGRVQYHPEGAYFYQGGVQAGTRGVAVFYGVDNEITKLTRFGGKVSVGSEGVKLTLRFIRAGISFSTSILVSHFPSLGAVFYATAVPLLMFGGLKVLAIAPLLRRQRQIEVAERRAEKAREMLEKKKEAEVAIELMTETVDRVLSVERAKQGLIIVEAWYGKLFDLDPASGGLGLPKVIDVHVPLQCLVVDSKLILREENKACIPGFYDPCIGEAKFLRVRYEFRGTPHEVTVENSESLVIPRRSHRIVHFVD